MSLNAGHTALKIVLAGSLLALVAGCGGGGSQDSLLIIPAPAPTPAPAPPVPPPQATAWSGATAVEISAESADQPHVAYSASGHAMAVWTQFDGVVTSIWASKFDQPSNTWRKADLVEQIIGGDAAGPRVSVDAAGNALVVWQQRVAGGASQWSIYANHYRSSNGTWATAEPIETGTAGDAVVPTVVVDTGGNGLAVWRQFDGAHADVWANRYTASTTSWGTPTLLESDDTGSADAPRIAMDGNGNAIAVWSQKVFNWNSIWANRFIASTGSWDAATLVESNDTSNARFPEVALDNTGNAVVVWREDTAPSRIASNRFNVGAGTWGTPTLIDTGASVATFPAVAMDGDGNALAVWTQGDDAMANRFDAGSGTWGAPVLIETNNMGPQGVYDVVIAADKAGNAIAVWDQFDGIEINIFANRYNAGTGTWGTANVIETDNAGPARSVRIANDPLTGSALAVWTQEDGAGLKSIVGNHFK